jgi:hypothetical protein
MSKQSYFSPTKALIVTNLYVLLSFGLAQLGSQLGIGIFDGWLRISPVLTGLFATGTALLAVRASQSGSTRPWQALALGFGFFTVAELTWAFQADLSSTPVATGADWFWLLGYIPIGIAIQLQLNQSRANINWLKTFLAILAGTIVTYLFSSFALNPMYGNAQLGQGLTAVFNILYPALDVTLVIGSVLILQAVPGSSPWRVIAIAFLLWVYADLSYAILNWTSAYGTNGMSLFSVEIPYNLAYLLLGISCLQAASVTQTAHAKDTASAPQPI